MKILQTHKAIRSLLWQSSLPRCQHMPKNLEREFCSSGSLLWCNTGNISRFRQVENGLHWNQPTQNIVSNFTFIWNAISYHQKLSYCLILSFRSDSLTVFNLEAKQSPSASQPCLWRILQGTQLSRLDRVLLFLTIPMLIKSQIPFPVKFKK